MSSLPTLTLCMFNESYTFCTCVFNRQINLHKHEDILREEIIDESTLPRRERIKRGCINHARIFLAVFSQKIFLRHRSLLTTFVEVFFSPIMAFLIFSAFTHGISWDKALHEKSIAGITSSPLIPADSAVCKLQSYSFQLARPLDSKILMQSD